MPEVYPFQAIQYKQGKGDVSALVAPPYDVLDAQDKKKLLSRDARNVVAIDLPHVPAKELGPPEAYQGAAEQLQRLLALAGSVIYDLDEEETARTSVGALIDHSPVTSTSIELRTIEPIDSTYLDLVNRYRLGDRYSLYTTASYDVDADDFRRVSMELARELPALIVGFGVTYDNIQETTSFGFSVQPKGLGPALRFQGVGTARQGTSFGG